MTEHSMPMETSYGRRFVVEAREHLAGMTAALIALEGAGGVDEAQRAHIEQLLRSAHSIKGGAGFTGRRKVEQLAHAMETAVENLRDGRITATGEVIDALLAALDRIGGMVDDLEQSDATDISEPMARLRPLIELTVTPEKGPIAAVRAPPFPPPPPPTHPPHPPALPEALAAQPGEFPLSERVRSGWQQGRALLYGVKLDWFACEQAFRLGPIEVARRLEAVGTVLDSRVTLVGPKLREGLPTPPLWYHAIVSSALDPERFSRELNIPGAAVIRLQNVSERFARAGGGEGAPAEPRSKPPAAATSLRISVPLIDRMMELSGELALVRNQALRSTDPANAPLRRLMRRLDSVTTELQDAALRMRMQPVGTLFDRFPRMVRDLARQLGKQIEIKITGSEVELDKTVLEILADPLTHLFRNCCDHGIELPGQRARSGKPAAGLITLSARQERGQIVIEMRDDGKGLDPEAIKRKALQQGIKHEHELAALSERQLYDLISLSGFSTAARVTDLSGRGVGMDVVKTNLDQVGGTVEIDSAFGRGTCFSLRLPLTLAIMPCLLVTSGSSRYAIPQRDVEEIVLLDPAQAGMAGRIRIECTQDEEVLRLRGVLAPLVRLSEVLASREPFTSQSRAAIIARHHPPHQAPGRQYAAILRVWASHRFGLVVDNVLESEDIVVKPLHPLLRQLGVFVAATILGDGGIALILGGEGIARHSGILHRPIAQALPAPEAGSDESQTLLLFKYGPAELLAMPLAGVQRVVRIRRDAIERVGGRELVNVDGTAVNLIRLDQILNLSACADLEQFYLILPRNHKAVGLLASEIVDSPTLSLQLDDQAYKVDGVLGSAMVRGQITILVDADRLVRIWEGIQITTPAQPPGGIRRSILIVEDTQFFQRLISGFLEAEGYEVVLAGNGSVGLEKLNEGTFDLIISDIEMPVMDGLTFARKVRDMARFAEIPLLALTTLSTPESRSKATESGFDAYEVKLDRGRFLETVHDLLKRGRPAAVVRGGPAHA